MQVEYEVDKTMPPPSSSSMRIKVLPIQGDERSSDEEDEEEEAVEVEGGAGGSEFHSTPLTWYRLLRR